MHNKPLPLGHVEVQRAWNASAPKLDTRIPEALEEVKQQMQREHPGLVFCGSRLEETFDGAGVAHYCLYMGFAPLVQSSEPLDPRNLNGVTLHDQIGDPARDNNIGSKEQKF